MIKKKSEKKERMKEAKKKRMKGRRERREEGRKERGKEGRKNGRGRKERKEKKERKYIGIDLGLKIFTKITIPWKKTLFTQPGAKCSDQGQFST